MQLKQAKARDGYLWIRQGFWLFKKNPLAFFMLIFLYIFMFVTLMMVHKSLKKENILTVR